MSTMANNTKAAINTAIIQFHEAAQFLAMLTHAFLPNASDDSHNNLLWQDGGLKSRTISGKNDFYAQLNYSNFSIDLCTPEGKVLHSIALDYNGLEKVNTAVSTALEQMGFDKNKFKPITHFEIPDHPIKNGDTFSKPDSEVIAAIINLRTQAQKTLEFFASHIKEGLEVRVWPHHFDTGVYGTLDNQKDGIGMGWAIADSIHDEPYFYLSPYTNRQTVNYENERKWQGPGLFIQNSFTGATLSLDNYQSLTAEAQEKIIFSFFDYGFRYLKLTMES